MMASATRTARSSARASRVRVLTAVALAMLAAQQLLSCDAAAQPGKPQWGWGFPGWQPTSGSEYGCSPGDRKDCQGRCVGAFYVDHWHGDGVCDDGWFLPGGLGVDMACEMFGSDGGDCPAPQDFEASLPPVPAPLVRFPLREDAGAPANAIWSSEGAAGRYKGTLANAEWMYDYQLKASVLHCTKSQGDEAFLDDIPYGGGEAGFGISFWMRNTPESQPGSYFEYMFSHGAEEPDLWSPNNINIFMPEDKHPARGVVRTILKDFNDDTSRWYYVDTDGLAGVNTPRDLHGHPNLDDGNWHHYVLAVTGPEGSKGDKKGYRVYLDGKLAAIARGGLEYEASGGDPVDPEGPIHLCGRGDNDPFRHYGGYLTELAFYDQYLSGKEVYALWNAQYSVLFSASSPAKSAAEGATGSGGEVPPPSCEELMTQTDCNGACFGDVYVGWVGDKICDDGFYGRADGGGLDMACEAWRFDGGDCAGAGSPIADQYLPKPKANFKFNDGAGTEVKSADGRLTGHTDGAEWVHDDAFGEYVLQCSKQQADTITLPDVQYGKDHNHGGFTVSFWFKNPSSPGFLFEYLYSHGHDVTSWAKDNLHIYLPEESHPASGVIRTIIKDENDDTEGEYYLDSDGQINNNSPRALPGQVDINDGEWHMYTLSAGKSVRPPTSGPSLPANTGGFSVYIDGRFAGHGLNGGDDFNPAGEIKICGRSDDAEERNFGGMVAHVHIYDQPLTGLQIMKLMAENCPTTAWEPCSKPCQDADGPGTRSRSYKDGARADLPWCKGVPLTQTCNAHVCGEGPQPQPQPKPQPQPQPKPQPHPQPQPQPQPKPKPQPQPQPKPEPSKPPPASKGGGESSGGGESGSGESGDSSVGGGHIAAITVSAVVVIAVAGAGIFLFMRRRGSVDDRRTDLYRRVADLEAEGELDFGTDADAVTHDTYRAPVGPADGLDDAEEVLGSPAAARLKEPNTSSAVAVRVEGDEVGAGLATAAGSTEETSVEDGTSPPRDDHPLL